MQARLTKRYVDSIKPGAKDSFSWDADLKGFGLKVTPAGRRIFVVQYWAPGIVHRRRRVTLGSYGKITPDGARTAAARILGRVANGEDPAAEVEARRESAVQTVDVVSGEYLVDVDAKMKPRTSREYRRLFNTYILPAFGNRPIADIALRDVSRLQLSHQQHPYQANRIVQLLQTFFNWAETRGHRARGSNPCRDVKDFPEHSRERFLSAEEIGRLGTALATAEQVGLPPAPKHRCRATS